MVHTNVMEIRVSVLVISAVDSELKTPVANVFIAKCFFSIPFQLHLQLLLFTSYKYLYLKLSPKDLKHKS